MLSLKNWVGKNKKYLGLLALIVILVIIAIIVTPGNHNSKKTKSSAEPKTKQLVGKGQGQTASYTYISSDVSCKEVPSYPGADTTINVCDGSLVVTDKSDKTQTYKLTSASHLYNTGQEQPLGNLSGLVSGQTKLALIFDKADKTSISNIVYFQQ